MKKNRVILSIVFILAVILYIFTTVDFAAFLIGAVFIYVVAAVFVTALTGKDICCSFSPGSEGKKGEKAEIHFIAENKSFIPVFFCSAVINVENRLTGTATTAEKNFSLLPRRKKSFDFSITDYCCGAVKTELKELYVSDPLKIIVKKIPDVARITTEHMVLPLITELSLKKEELDRYDMESYRYSQQKKGDDSSETFGIRSYVPGDNIKAIHWKLSSKMDDIVIREYGLPVENHVLVIADKRTAENRIMPPELKSELTELYLSVLYTLAKQGLHHDAGWYDYERHEFQCRKVATTEDVYEIMPYLLSSPFKEDRMSSADHYIESDTDQDYGSYIYVTAGLQEEDSGIGRLRNYGEVDIYRPENFKH